MRLLSHVKAWFLQSRNSRPLRRTAYLDGLRGAAAFFVFNDHFISHLHGKLQNTYVGHGTSIIQLPIIRVVHSGSGMVAVFFMVSGYALSYNTLQRIHEGSFGCVLDNLASSISRRAIRLFLPVAASTFISLLLLRAGFTYDQPYHLTPTRTSTFWLQLEDWGRNICFDINPFRSLNIWALEANAYDKHTWTIPIEYRGSIVVYLMLLALAKTKPVARIVVLAYFLWLALYLLRWDIFLFLAGMLVADINILPLESIPFPLPPLGIKNSRCGTHIRSLTLLVNRYQTALLHSLTIVLFLFSLFLLSWPHDGAESTFGYMTLSNVAPSRFIAQDFGQADAGNAVKHYWLAIGAVLLVTSISFSPVNRFESSYYIPLDDEEIEKHLLQESNSPILQYIFVTPPAQFLGRISYSFYLIHGPVLFSFGDWFLLTSKEYVGHTTSSLVSWLITYVFTVGVAVFFETFIDRNAVKAGKWVVALCWVAA